MKRIIAIDIDDVIADSTEAVRHVVNKKTGAELKAEHYRVAGDYRGYYDRVWEEHSIDHIVNLKELLTEMREDQSHIPLLPGAAFAISKLSKKFKIVFVTARMPDLAESTKKWLSQHFQDGTIDVYYVGNDPTELAKSKGETCVEIGASWLIDDNPEHCLSAVEFGSNAILFGDYGWHFDAPNHLVRCKDWPAVLEYFNAQPK